MSSPPRSRQARPFSQIARRSVRRASRAVAAGSAGEARPLRRSRRIVRAAIRSGSCPSTASPRARARSGWCRPDRVAPSCPDRPSRASPDWLRPRLREPGGEPQDRSAAPARSLPAACADKGRSRRPGSATVRLRGHRRSRGAPSPPSRLPRREGRRRGRRTADAPLARAPRRWEPRSGSEDRDKAARCRR